MATDKPTSKMPELKAVSLTFRVEQHARAREWLIHFANLIGTDLPVKLTIEVGEDYEPGDRG